MPLHGFSPNDFTGFQWVFHLLPFTFSIEIMGFLLFDVPWGRKKWFNRKKTVSTSQQKQL